MVEPINQPSAEAVGQQLQPGDSYIPVQYKLKGSIIVEQGAYAIQTDGYLQGPWINSITAIVHDKGNIAITGSDNRTFVCLGNYQGRECLSSEDLQGLWDFANRVKAQGVSVQLYVARDVSKGRNPDGTWRANPSSKHWCGMAVVLRNSFGNSGQITPMNYWTPQV